MSDFDPGRGETRVGEGRLREFKVFLGSHAEPDALGVGFAGLEHQAVVAALLQPAQPDRAGRLITDDEAEQIDVERPRRRQVAHVMNDVAGARDVETRFVDRSWQTE